MPPTLSAALPNRCLCFRRAERIGAFLVERGRLNAGDHVALIFPPGIDFIAAFYGCLVAGESICTRCAAKWLFGFMGLNVTTLCGR